jgi:hypothetical protein
VPSSAELAFVERRVEGGHGKEGGFKRGVLGAGLGGFDPEEDGADAMFGDVAGREVAGGSKRARTEAEHPVSRDREDGKSAVVKVTGWEEAANSFKSKVLLL